MPFANVRSHLCAVVLVLAAGCADLPTDEAQKPHPPATSLPDPRGVTPGDVTALALGKPRQAAGDRFATSTACALCHSNTPEATAMRDAAGREIAPFNLWSGTMMANAARDPIWRAMVSAEIARTPALAEAIEAKCLRCHSPIASEVAHASDREPRLADLTEGIATLRQLATDGVSCTVCHQIQEAGLGTEESFSGGFTIGSERKIFGPHRSPATAPMQNHVNYTPTYGTWITESRLCATCHTLFTHPALQDGTLVDGASFPEQTAYFEWRNSAFDTEEGQPDGRSCQSCHLPTSGVDGEETQTRIARSPPGGDFNIAKRKPFGRHLLVGGNTLVPAILKAERDTLNPLASDEALDAVIAATRERLQVGTAELSIARVARVGEVLSFDVAVTSRVGHKFPTGFPSRRAWLQVRVLDAAGAVVFSSGAFNEEGRITDQSGAVLDIEKAGGPVEPHRNVIRRSDEVQVWEAAMADGQGAYTSTLLRAVRHLKDDRLLPLGWSDTHETAAHTRPVAVGTDPDFTAGGDVVHYELAIPKAARLEATLRYQAFGARFATELFQVDTPEVAALRTMYERADRTPVEVATTSQDL